MTFILIACFIGGANRPACITAEFNSAAACMAAKNKLEASDSFYVVPKNIICVSKG